MEDGVRERLGIPFIGRLRPRRACPGREARRESRRARRGHCARKGTTLMRGPGQAVSEERGVGERHGH